MLNPGKIMSQLFLKTVLNRIFELFLPIFRLCDDKPVEVR